MLVNFFPMQCNAMSEDSPNAKIKLLGDKHKRRRKREIVQRCPQDTCTDPCLIWWRVLGETRQRIKFHPPTYATQCRDRVGWAGLGWTWLGPLPNNRFLASLRFAFLLLPLLDPQTAPAWDRLSCIILGLNCGTPQKLESLC